MSMSRCSSSVLTVKGRVGLVDEGRTCSSPQILMMSGACPPPRPRCERRGWCGPSRRRRCSQRNRFRSACRCGSSPARPSHPPPTGSSRWHRGSSPNPHAISMNRPRPAPVPPTRQGARRCPCPQRQGSSERHPPPATSARCAMAPACRWWPACHARGQYRRPTWWSARNAAHPQSAADR